MRHIDDTGDEFHDDPAGDREFGTAGETIYGSYGEFEAVPDDVDWDAHNAEFDQWAAAWAEDAANYPDDDGAYDPYSDVEQGMYDDDPNPYHGDYSEM